MPLATRHFLPGHVWHITHRCHHNNHCNPIILGRSKAREPAGSLHRFSLAKAATKTLEESGFSNRQRASFRACRALRCLVHVEGGFDGLIQFLDLAGIARAH